MPWVVARYIVGNLWLPASGPDFITRAGAAIQCWKTPRIGHNSGTVNRQDALDTGSSKAGNFLEARRSMASIVQSPVIRAAAVQAPAVPSQRDLRLDLFRGLAL